MSATSAIRVGVISQVPPPVHGQTVMTLRFLDALAALGLEHRLVDRRFSASIDEVGRISARKLLSVVGLVLRALRLVVADRPAVTVFFVTTRPASFLVDWLVSEALRLGSGRVVLYVHSVGFADLDARGGLWRFAVRRLFGAHVEVVTLGDHLVPDIAALIPTERRSTIANTPGVVPAVGSEGDVADVLFLSNLMPGKGAEDFVRIANALPTVADGSWTCTIAGAHADDQVVQTVHEGIDAAPPVVHHRLVGPVSADDKWALLAGARCLAFTSSLPEAQPLTIAEAFACGTPVVAFRRGGIPDLVVDGVNGYLVEPGDDDRFTRCIAAIAGDAALRARLSAGARSTFESTLSTTSYADAWRSVLDGAVR